MGHLSADTYQPTVTEAADHNDPIGVQATYRRGDSEGGYVAIRLPASKGINHHAMDEVAWLQPLRPDKR